MWMEWMMELENLHLANTTVAGCKSSEWRDEIHYICTILKYLPHKTLINYKGKSRETCRLQFNWVIKGSITNNETFWHLYFLIGGFDKDTALLHWYSCPKKLYLIMRKYSNWGTFYKNNWPAVFKSVKIIKVKEKLRNFPRLEEI